MLIALDEYLDPVEIVIVRGAAAELAGLAGGARARVCAAAHGARDSGGRRGPAGSARDASARGERTVAYVCRGPQLLGADRAPRCAVSAAQP